VVRDWVRGYESMTASDRIRFATRLRLIVEAGEIRLTSRILSIGAGTGHHESHLPVHPICMDRSTRMCSVQKEKGLVTVRGDAEHLPFKDSSFELVLAIDLSPLHYSAAQRQRVLVECRRILRPGGRIVLLTANERWVRLTSLIRSGNPNADRYRVHPRELARQLRSLGIRIMRVPHVEYIRMEPRNALGTLFGLNLMNHWTVTVGAK